MTRNTLLIAAAVAALTAGSSVAFAQSTPESKTNPASKNAPAEKIAPSPAVKPAGAAEHAQRGEEKRLNQMGNKIGQAPANERSRIGQANERNKSKAETTGQAPSETSQPAAPSTAKQNKLKSNAEEKKSEGNAEHKTFEGRAERREPNRTTTGQGAPENRGAMESRQPGAAAGTSSTAAVRLTTEQKSRIHTVIIGDRSAPRVAHADFNIHVGTVVPRSVRLAPVPARVVEIAPVWRGFEFFLVGDEIVIVDPADLHIVAVIPA